MDWKQLHDHYTQIKQRHHLISADIFRQLGYYPNFSYVDYLKPSGYNRNPSNKPGTVGRKVRDILITGLNKDDWKPSTATYEEKLREQGYDHTYMNVHILNSDSKDAVPELEISLCMDVGPMLSKEELSHMFTIDNIVPKIVDVHKSYQLVYRAYPYTPIGDRFP